MDGTGSHRTCVPVYPKLAFEPEDLLTFVQMKGFSDDWKNLRLDDDDLQFLQIAIMSDPVEERVVQRLQGFTEALENNEAISEQFNCHKVVLDLHPTPYDPPLVKETRKLLCTSQAVFANFLGVSVKTVCAWEQGKNTPQDVACRFMDEIRHNPKYWLDRIRELAVPKLRQ